MSGGNVHDYKFSHQLIEGLVVKYTIADRAYDGDSFLALAKSQSEEVIVPSKANRLEQRDIDKHVYKERHLVECFFAKIKAYRRVSTRYEKLMVTYHAVVTIAACLVWLL